MEMEYEIRQMVDGDVEAVSALILGQLSFFTVDPEGVGADAFRTTVAPEAVRERLHDARYLHRVAEIGGRVVAVGVMRDRSHLYHLIVASDFHRRGLGKALWRHMLDELAADGYEGPFTVNASRYGVAVYETMGFRPTAEEKIQDGIVFRPMERPLRSR